MLIAPPVAASLVTVPAPGASLPPAAGFDHVFDFPGFAGGQTFRIVAGSTANGVSVKGDARIDALTATSAAVWIKAGRFGINKEANLRLEQTSPTSVHVLATEKGKAPIEGDAQIQEVRTGYSAFNAAPGGAFEGAVALQLDPSGRLVIDVDGGSAGVADAKVALHLILERVPAAALVAG